MTTAALCPVPRPDPAAPAGHDPAGPLRADRDVLARVGWLLDSYSRHQRGAWLMFVAATGVQLPVAVPVEPLPGHSELAGARSLCWIAAEAMRQFAPDSLLVLALTRPGPAEAGPGDRKWERALRRAARERGVPVRMLCLATPDGVSELGPAGTAREAGAAADGQRAGPATRPCRRPPRMSQYERPCPHAQRGSPGRRAPAVQEKEEEPR